MSVAFSRLYHWLPPVVCPFLCYCDSFGSCLLVIHRAYWCVFALLSKSLTFCVHVYQYVAFVATLGSQFCYSTMARLICRQNAKTGSTLHRRCCFSYTRLSTDQMGCRQILCSYMSKLPLLNHVPIFNMRRLGVLGEDPQLVKC